MGGKNGVFRLESIKNGTTFLSSTLLELLLFLSRTSAKLSREYQTFTLEKDCPYKELNAEKVRR